VPLMCLVTVELARPGVSPELVARWKLQRESGRDLAPDPDGELRTWRGWSDDRDWERLIAFKRRDGCLLVSYRREFIDCNDEVQDKVEHA